MKRDMNLVREILIWAEAQDHGYSGGNPKIEGHTDEEIAFHVHLIGQAGLAKVADVTDLDSKSPEALFLSITDQGYEFLIAAKDNSIWAKAKETIIKPGATMTVNLLFEWLKAEAKTRLGFP